MRITEYDRLARDLYQLKETRKDLGDILERMATGKTETLAWLRLELTAMIHRINARIGDQKDRIMDQEFRQRLGEDKGGDQDDTCGMGAEDGNENGERDRAGETDRAAGDRKDPDSCGCAKAGDQHECQRVGAETGRGVQLEPVGTVRGMAEGTAEECLRYRFRVKEAKRRAEEVNLRDWQRQIMEADMTGKHGRMTI